MMVLNDIRKNLSSLILNLNFLLGIIYTIINYCIDFYLFLIIEMYNHHSKIKKFISHFMN